MEFEAVNVLVYLYMKKAYTRGSASHLKFSNKNSHFLRDSINKISPCIDTKINFNAIYPLLNDYTLFKKKYSFLFFPLTLSLLFFVLNILIFVITLFSFSLSLYLSVSR